MHVKAARNACAAGAMHLRRPVSPRRDESETGLQPSLKSPTLPFTSRAAACEPAPAATLRYVRAAGTGASPRVPGSEFFDLKRPVTFCGAARSYLNIARGGTDAAPAARRSLILARQ